MTKHLRNAGWSWLLLLLLLLLPVGCNDANAEEAVVGATPTAAAVVIVVPTVTPTAAPTVTATLAAAPTQTAILTATPTVAAAVQPTALPLPERAALIRYRDNQYTRSGDFTILSTNLPPAAAGHHYDLWLTKDGQPTFRLGSLPNQTPLNFTSSADQHLLAIYEGALITLEPDADTPGEMGPILYQGVTPPEALIHIYALAPQAPLDLLLLHEPAVVQPSDTHRWLERRPGMGHYHLRRHDPAQMASLARRLTGNPIGLALSGGGARGFAHLGLLRALEELQIPWDWIGGASMGALVGIGFALAMPYERALAQTAALSNPQALFDYTLPLVSLLASDKVTEIIRAIVGEQRIEDLWRPYFAIATDLSAAEMVVQERGLLWRAVRASLSIPGIFAPVIDERGHLLVDGGLMNNFPVDVLRARLGTGSIIGMNVGHVAGDDQVYAYEGGLSGWQVLRSRFDPRAEPIAAPSLASILVRAMMVNNQRQVQQSQQLCDLLIEPTVQRFGLLQFTDYAAIAELGYAAARPALAAWKARHSDHPQF